MFKGQPVTSSDHVMRNVGITYSLEIPEVLEDDAGLFSIVAGNSLGQAKSEGFLTVDKSFVGNLARKNGPAGGKSPHTVNDCIFVRGGLYT